MGKINWTRVFLCGLVTGFVCTLLSSILLILVGEDFLTALRAGRPNALSSGVHLFLFITNLAAGIWAVWLYAMLRPRSGPGPKTAVVAGLAWWVIVSLQSSKWVALGFVPASTVFGPLAATLPAIIAAALTGAWLYDRNPAKVLNEGSEASPAIG